MTRMELERVLMTPNGPEMCRGLEVRIAWRSRSALTVLPLVLSDAGRLGKPWGSCGDPLQKFMEFSHSRPSAVGMVADAGSANKRLNWTAAARNELAMTAENDA